ncbi:unnamed protein product [Nesidiocoris tenuis]|uniref:Uncharacterized protein n=1 Tax=Nesidiocoris tenuis TaxID=355587 RepID=A0A6H5G1Z0_9HEMI|nr:unnamed protein product [Nesidiocoris tenuis]
MIAWKSFWWPIQLVKMPSKLTRYHISVSTLLLLQQRNMLFDSSEFRMSNMGQLWFHGLYPNLSSLQPCLLKILQCIVKHVKNKREKRANDELRGDRFSENGYGAHWCTIARCILIVLKKTSHIE